MSLCVCVFLFSPLTIIKNIKKLSSHNPLTILQPFRSVCLQGMYSDLIWKEERSCPFLLGYVVCPYRGLQPAVVLPKPAFGNQQWSQHVEASPIDPVSSPLSKCVYWQTCLIPSIFLIFIVVFKFVPCTFSDNKDLILIGLGKCITRFISTWVSINMACSQGQID